MPLRSPTSSAQGLKVASAGPAAVSHAQVGASATRHCASSAAEPECRSPQPYLFWQPYSWAVQDWLTNPCLHDQETKGEILAASFVSSVSVRKAVSFIFTWQTARDGPNPGVYSASNPIMSMSFVTRKRLVKVYSSFSSLLLICTGRAGRCMLDSVQIHLFLSTIKLQPVEWTIRTV